MQNTIYLIGLSAEDTRRVQEDFHVYPFPGWRLELLSIGADPPVNVLAGQSVLVIGCGTGGQTNHVDAMWILRLFACGCPWVAVSIDPQLVSQEICEAAGASAFLIHPFAPAKLRELIWFHVVPNVGKTPVVPITIERLMPWFAVVRADTLLKFTNDTGRTGYLALRSGSPVNAKVLEGPEGMAGLHEILNWGRGKVLFQAIPHELPTNLQDRPEAWLNLLRPIGGGQALASQPVPGGREACDLVVRDLPEVVVCALVDLRSGFPASYPSTGTPENEADLAFIAAATELLRSTYQTTDADAPEESAEGIVALGRDGWWAGVRLGTGPFALLVLATGQAQLGLANQVFAAAATELEQQSGVVVEDTEVEPKYG